MPDTLFNPSHRFEDGPPDPGEVDGGFARQRAAKMGQIFKIFGP